MYPLSPTWSGHSLKIDIRPVSIRLMPLMKCKINRITVALEGENETSLLC